jgi:site-specific DNA-methyltransferase (adenine-specific)
MIDLRTGDCIELAKQLDDNSIDCTVTSPPYNKQKIGGGLFRKIEYDKFDDSLPEDVYQEQQIELLNVLFDKTKEGGSLFYNHKVRYLEGNATSPWAWLPKTKWHIREEIIWNRGSGPEISGYRFTQIDERIYWLCKGAKRPKLPRRSVNYGSVWKFGPEMKNPHPAPFPIVLPLRCIQAVMETPGVVLDPYSGSGTTGLAATLLGHDYIGFDLSDDYHAMARERISNPSRRDLEKFTEECGVEVNSERGLFSLLET